jgi:hypothetical protein
MQPAHNASKRNASVQLNDQFAVEDKLLEWDVRQCRRNLREVRPKDDFPLSSTVPLSLNAKRRNPSLRMNCHRPSLSGSASADLASMGAAPSRKEDKSGNATPVVPRALTVSFLCQAPPHPFASAHGA